LRQQRVDTPSSGHAMFQMMGVSAQFELAILLERRSRF
jgi:DNA invertase Pin-like site-specific DNA recombinase